MATTTPPQPPLSNPTSDPTSDPTSTDPFDTLLTLEDQFYTEGYNQGMADGLAAGRAEGRQLGLERGFQKFVEAGRLQGRAIVWANRLRGSSSLSGVKGQGVKGGNAKVEGLGNGGVGLGSLSSRSEKDGQVGGESGAEETERRESGFELPPLPDNPRLAKHITTLYALVETESLSTVNNDEAVDDFDDRLRRAQGRAKVIERMVGEGDNGKQKAEGQGHGHDPGNENGNVNGASKGGVDI